LADNNLNWVDTPEVKDFLPLPENVTFQQPSQLIDLLAEIISKLAANLTSTMNSTSLIART